MPVRALTHFETAIAQNLVDLGNLKNWEFAAFVESPNGPLIEFITRMTDDGADPSSDVRNKATAGVDLTVHHNHLSQESLSFADWYGLATFFDETFAHCADGTCYWGRVINKAKVLDLHTNRAIAIENDALNALFSIIPNGPDAAALSDFFRKEVVNEAMKLRGFVEYEVDWGHGHNPPYVRPGNQPPPGPAGIIGALLSHQFAAAAAVLAPTL